MRIEGKGGKTEEKSPRPRRREARKIELAERDAAMERTGEKTRERERERENKGEGEGDLIEINCKRARVNSL